MNSFFFHSRRSFASLFTNNFKVFYFIVVLLIATGNSVLSQAPLAIPYQAVARTSSGNLIINQAVSVRFSIRDGNVSGTIVYQEKHSPTTNALGLFSVNIGGGTVVTGTMANINWGNGAKFLQVELDPAGGSSYINMGTSQMMSVPYALSARTVEQNGGKTYLVLTGDITDAQAAAIITRDAGPNTQFVKIINTTNLTTVNLSGIRELIKLDIQNTTGLTTVNLSNLTTVYEEVIIKGNQDLASFAAPSLQEVDGEIQIISNGITFVDLSALATTGAGSNLLIQSNPALTSVDLGSLTTWQSSASPGFLIDGSEALASIDLGNLTSIRNGAFFMVDGSFSLTTLSLGNLKSVFGSLFIATYIASISINLNALDTISGEVRIVGDGIASINAGSLKYISGKFSTESTSLTTIDLDGLTVINGTFDINSADNLTLLKLSHLTTVTVGSGFFRVGNSPILASLDLSSLNSITGGYFSISNNNNLSTLDMSGLTSIGDASNIILSQCNFTSAGVNSLLASMANALPFNSVNIDLTTFGGASPPTGQGITDKNSIISNGNTVTTD